MSEQTPIKSGRNMQSHSTVHNYETNDGTTDIASLDISQQQVPQYGDQLLPSSLRSTNNPFSAMTNNTNEGTDISPVISAALSSPSSSINSNVVESTPFVSNQTEVILTNDAIKQNDVGLVVPADAS
jgi:hypothetical protein